MSPYIQNCDGLYMSGMDGQNVKEQSSDRVILQNDVIYYLGE